MRTVRPLLLTLIAALTIAVPAALAAKSKHGITPIAPKKGATVPTRSRPVFKGKVSGPGQVFVFVCKSKKVDKHGLICHKEMIQQAHKKNGTFQTKAKFFDYPEFWLNSPGTYYWQAHRIQCVTGSRDCDQEGPIVKFKVQ